jgi:hypothetical protein
LRIFLLISGVDFSGRNREEDEERKCNNES